MSRPMSGPSPYALLGVTPQDSFATIRAAWVRLIKAHHPDLHPGHEAEATAQLADINEAYDRLALLHNRVSEAVAQHQARRPSPPKPRPMPRRAPGAEATAPAPEHVPARRRGPLSAAETQFKAAQSLLTETPALCTAELVI